ncbi:hypothetical protein [Eggerthella lenta]|uniref:hypothetical protein n=1 Tax=Eggerthella lenta TaxID=84112 RepID=UPI0013052C14|nr:hypothetical protein [Eggerthella lenta]
MPDKRKARRSLESGRASVYEDDRSIPQDEFERGMRMLWIPFALLLALYALWEAVA